MTFRLDASEPDVPLVPLSPNWFSGVSAVEVTSPEASKIVNDPQARAKALQALRIAIPSETYDPELSVGPELDGDDADCDKGQWCELFTRTAQTWPMFCLRLRLLVSRECGFDSSVCFCGLFCASHSCAPSPTAIGQNRPHEKIYLVCKAGAGLAASTFHARLLASLKQKKSLHEPRDESITRLPQSALAGRVASCPKVRYAIRKRRCRQRYHTQKSYNGQTHVTEDCKGQAKATVTVTRMTKN